MTKHQIVNWWMDLLFKWNSNRNLVKVADICEVAQFHPDLGFRLRPKYQEWFDHNIEGKFTVFRQPNSVSFSRMEDAILFKLTFA